LIKKVLKVSGITVASILFVIVILICLQLNNYKKLESVEINDFELEVIPFTLSNSGHIVVNVKVQGKDKNYPFILDSGASNIIFKNKISEFDFENNGVGIGKGANGSYFFSRIKNINTIHIKSISFKNFNVKEVAHNFDCFDDYYGLIGLGLMHRLNWQIDFQKKEITVTKNFEELNFEQNKIEFDLVENQFSHHLSIPLKLTNSSTKIYPIVDLGNSGNLSLDENLIFEDSLKLNSSKVIEKKTLGLGNSKNRVTESKMYYVDSLITNSNYAFNNFMFKASPNSLNLLGLGVFKNYKTTISWSEKKLILEPYTKDINFNYETFGLGITSKSETKKIIISSITENSDAFMHNIELGMEVIMINELENKNSKSLCEFKNEISKSDSIIIKLQKNKEVKTYKLFKKSLHKTTEYNSHFTNSN
jgi:hypothetical protein